MDILMWKEIYQKFVLLFPVDVISKKHFLSKLQIGFNIKWLTTLDSACFFYVFLYEGITQTLFNFDLWMIDVVYIFMLILDVLFTNII